MQILEHVHTQSNPANNGSTYNFIITLKQNIAARHPRDSLFRLSPDEHALLDPGDYIKPILYTIYKQLGPYTWKCKHILDMIRNGRLF